MGGRALLMSLAGIIVLSTSIFYAITTSGSDITSNVDRYYATQLAQNIAQTGANMALRQLNANPGWRSGFGPLTIMGGTMKVSAKDTLLNTVPVVRLMSIGTTTYVRPGERIQYPIRDTSIAYVSAGFMPATVKAAITTNNKVSTLGNLIVDGRDHTLAGALRSLSGTLGIWTTKTLSQSGNSRIGGTQATIDYPPSKPGNASIIAQNQIWPGGYPGSPDSVLGANANGYPEGRLKALAQSGTNGSQYVTNPGNLTTPLRGVTYVELPSGGTWQSMDISGSGILVVHNSSKNAIMKNMNSGTFVGLMIVDDPVHIHTNIIGALIGLTPSPSEGNCIGNGNGSVLFSSQAVFQATGIAGGSGSGTGSQATLVAWWE